MNQSEQATRGPLAHVRVLDLSRMYPGAYCTLLLADLGADVLKVEAPGRGDGMRFMTPEPFAAGHVALNRGKRSMTLDLKHERAPDILRRLVRDADVVVESQRPGSLEALGVGFEHLRQENPGLVWCSLTGFGPDGPNVDMPGHDLTYAGYSGLLHALTVDGTPPVPSTMLSLPIAALMGAVGILAALSARDRTGVGARVDADMTDAAMWLMSEQMTRAANAPGPMWGSFASRAVYKCADGRFVTVTASEPKPWARLCEALGLPELLGYRIGTDEEATTRALATAFAREPAAHWRANPGLAGGVGPVNDADDLVDDPQVTARHGLVPIDGGGPRVLANPVRIDGALGDAGSHALSPPPELGRHTDDVLAKAGFTADEIAALRTDGAV